MRCANCGHEKGCHRRKNWTMGRCYFRPRRLLLPDNPTTPKPHCPCLAFIEPTEEK